MTAVAVNRGGGRPSKGLRKFIGFRTQEHTADGIAKVAAHKGLTVTDHLRTVARQCYAWSMPYAMAFSDREDVVSGVIKSEAFQKRLEMFVRDVRVYGSVLAEQRQKDLSGTEPGFLARLRKY